MTHLVQSRAHVSVQNVHILVVSHSHSYASFALFTHSRSGCTFLTSSTRSMTDSDRAQHVAEPVQVLDGLEQLVERAPSADDVFGEQLGSDEGGQGEVMEGR
jgi:hypothetical protein